MAVIDQTKYKYKQVSFGFSVSGNIRGSFIEAFPLHYGLVKGNGKVWIRNYRRNIKGGMNIFQASMQTATTNLALINYEPLFGVKK